MSLKTFYLNWTYFDKQVGSIPYPFSANTTSLGRKESCYLKMQWIRFTQYVKIEQDKKVSDREIWCSLNIL